MFPGRNKWWLDSGPKGTLLFRDFRCASRQTETQVKARVHSLFLTNTDPKVTIKLTSPHLWIYVDFVWNMKQPDAEFSYLLNLPSCPDDQLVNRTGSADCDVTRARRLIHVSGWPAGSARGMSSLLPPKQLLRIVKSIQVSNRDAVFSPIKRHPKSWEKMVFLN